MHDKLPRLACGWVLCTLWLLTPTIGAAQEAPYAREGPFVGGGFMYAVEQFDLNNLQDRTGAHLHATDGYGLDLRGGYRFHPNFAVEGNVQFYGGMELESDHQQTQSGQYYYSNGNPDVIGFNFAANAKAYPLTGRIQPYGLFGIGVGVLSVDFSGDNFNDHHGNDTTEEDAAFMLRFGGGIDCYVTPKILIFAEASYNYLTSDLHFQGGPGIGANLIPVTIGAQYRFW